MAKIRMNALLQMLFVFLLSSPAALAGIRVINNGGGIAEMQALTLLTKLKSSFLPCLYSSKICTQVQRQAISNLLNSGAFDTENAELEFFVSHLSGEIYQYDSRNRLALKISSLALYSTNGRSKEISEIFNIVARGWLLRPGIDRESAEIALEWVSQWKTTLSSSFDLGEDRRLFVVENELSQGGTKIITVVEQSANVAKDLTFAIAAQLPCHRGSSQLTSFSPVSTESQFVIGKLTWSCADLVQKAQFALKMAAIESKQEPILIVSKIEQQSSCANYFDDN